MREKEEKGEPQDKNKNIECCGGVLTKLASLVTVLSAEEVDVIGHETTVFLPAAALDLEALSLEVVLENGLVLGKSNASDSEREHFFVVLR